jgi:predicted DNA-binding transcriptional regulator YafY
LDIVYLKANDTKSARRIEPFYIGELDYNGKQFLGVRARCLKRGGERVFRVDRMLEVRQAIEAFEIDKMGDML